MTQQDPHSDPLAGLLSAGVPGASSAIELGHSRLDPGRLERCGHPEVVYGAGKSPDELVEIATALMDEHGRVLVTRASEEGAAALLDAFGDVARHSERARCVTIGSGPEAVGRIAVVSAGTSDRPVALEAVLTARFLGARVDEVHDVGVAGLHRILEAAPRIREANAIVVVAGMEGALPSVVGGLVDRPVIACPTSVGYGASFGGLGALLGMLNSCASGVTVVNIDNGFGAAYAAAQINRAIVDAARANGERTGDRQ